MPIVETKTSIRPNTSVTFFRQSDNPLLSQLKTELGFVLMEQTPTYIKTGTADGGVINEHTLTNDGLTQHSKSTFSSIENYNRIETAIGINFDDEYRKYTELHGITHPVDQYAQTGFDAPFSCTTTYSYTTETPTVYLSFEYFINSLEASNKLSSFVNTGTQLIAVHEYLNSGDFTDNHWYDYPFIERLHAGKITRTIEYKLL